MNIPPIFRQGYMILLLAPLLSGCNDQGEQIQALREKIVLTQNSNNTAEEALQKITREGLQLRQKAQSQSTKRQEFEAKASRSGEAARLITKYREEMEVSLAAFEDSLAKYRQQFLTP